MNYHDSSIHTIINIIMVLLKLDESVQKEQMHTLKTFQQVLYFKINKQLNQAALCTFFKQYSILWHFLPYNDRRQ